MFLMSVQFENLSMHYQRLSSCLNELCDA